MLRIPLLAVLALSPLALLDDEPVSRVAGVVLAPDGAPAAGVEPVRHAIAPAGTIADARAPAVDVGVARSGDAQAELDPRDEAERPVARRARRVVVLHAVEVEVDARVPARARADRPRRKQLLRHEAPLRVRLHAPDLARGVAILRYPRAELEEAASASFPRVEVESTDGVWHGIAPIASAAPLGPLDVEILVEEVRASVAGVVLTKTGVPIFDVAVSLDLLDAPDGRGFRRRSSGASYTFARCPPGCYRLRAALKEDVYGVAAQRERIVVVSAGENRLEPLVFDEVVGGVDGRACHPDGELARCVVDLRRVDGGALPPAALGVLRWFRDGESRYSKGRGHRSGHFAFGTLPRGTYELTLEPEWPGSFAPVERTLVPPSHDLEITLSDHVPPRIVHLVPIDRASGAPIDRPVVVVTATDSHWSSTFLLRPGDVEAPPTGSFAWSLRMDGFRPALGDSSDLAGALEVPLEPGWGALVRFRRAATKSRLLSNVERTPLDPAVANLDVFADGVLVAQTDATGTALLTLEQRPETLTVGGWRIADPSGRVDVLQGRPFGLWSGGSVAAAERGHVLWLAPLDAVERER